MNLCSWCFEVINGKHNTLRVKTVFFTKNVGDVHSLHCNKQKNRVKVSLKATFRLKCWQSLGKDSIFVNFVEKIAFSQTFANSGINSYCKRSIHLFMRKILLLLFLITTSVFLAAQVPNDACPGAQDFGTLTPFEQTCLTGNNLIAFGELPYINQGYCFGGVDAPSPAADVWFTFTAVGNLLDIVLDSNFDTSMVALYQGTCDGLVGLKCVVNESGGFINTSLAPVSVGNTYFIQISGGSLSDIGNYSLCINSYQTFEAICIIDQTLSVDPPPYLSTYEAGQTVNFCLTVGGYQENSADWFDGLVPIFGSGWDLSTLVVTPPASCDGQGAWGWYNSVQGTSTYATTVVGPVGPGFFYDRNADGNPGNDFGDYSAGAACNWVFCFDISVKATCPPAIDGEDLSIEFFNYSDSEAGSWNASASPCPNDPNFTFKALLSCCTIPDVSGVSPTCDDPLSGYVTVLGGGNPPFTYDWSTGFSEVSFGASTQNNLPIGFYTITVTDADDCEKIISYLLDDSAIPSLAVAYTVPSTCNPGNGLAVLQASGTLDPYTFTLTDSLGNAITQTDTNFPNLAAGTYTAVVVDGGGCSNQTQVIVPGLPPLQVQTGSVQGGLCPGDTNGSISVLASGGFPPYSYSIDGGAPQTNGNFTALTGGDHTILVTDVSGCTATLTETIPEPLPVTALASVVADVLCFGGNEGEFQIEASGGTAPYTYAADGGAFQPQNNFTQLAAGQYNFVVQDANGCPASGSVTITQPDLLDIALPPDTEMAQGASVSLQPQIVSGQATTYNWAPAAGLDCVTCAQVIARPDETTTYTLQAANSNGCSDTASVTITVLKGGTVAIPNAFSPNNDGVNDIFRIAGRNVASLSLVIYNRWGQEVFASADINAGWNGRFKDAEAEIGTYVYWLEVTYESGNTELKKGNIILIR